MMQSYNFFLKESRILWKNVIFTRLAAKFFGNGE